MVSLFFVFKLPYHYDEAWTYNAFSPSILSAIGYYPLPNNHVFLNVLGSFFLLLPIGDTVAIRLPSVIATTLSTYYFFKLVRQFCTPGISLISTMIYAVSFPVMMYSYMARGYALILLFSVICTYCFARMLLTVDYRKYLVVFACSSVLGFFTIPSFLYFFVVADIAILTMLLRKKIGGIFYFGIANTGIMAATLLLYTPIIKLNGWYKLTDNSGVVRQKLPEIIEQFPQHVELTWQFISGIENSNLLFIIPVALVLIFNIFRGAAGRPAFAVFCLAILLSPVPLVFLHRAISFERTWIHLIIPVVFAAGWLVELLLEFIRKVLPPERKWKVPVALTVLLILSWGVVHSVIYVERHRKSHLIDYVVQQYIALLESRLPHLNTVAHTSKGLGFYIAEDIKFEKLVRFGSEIVVTIIDEHTEPATDIVISTKESPFIHSGDYWLLPNNNNFFIVYVKKDFWSHNSASQ